MQQLIEAKARCLADITAALPDYKERLGEADGRLVAYIEDAVSGEAEHANLYELLGIRKVLRLMDAYEVDNERVKKSLRAIEGVWKDGRHQRGGLKFDTPRGNRHVRLMPYQVWCLYGIYAFTTEVSMERPYVEGDELLPTEFVRDGEVWDRRRLTQEAHLFQTRKSGKTEFGGAIDFTEVCFLGPANGQALICTNSSEQSQIAYKAIKEFALQVDPSCINRLGGKFFRMTAKGMNWQPGHRMKGEIRTMAAGKVSKDGLYASVVHADEHGQARYVNGHSDMQAAVETCWGSTGPRREKLLMHTTTAGNVSEGPYKSKIESVEAALLRELDYPLGQPHRTEDDNWFAFLLRLDPWEVTDDLQKLDDMRLFKKVNRSIGTTVQPTYYRERLREAATSEDTKKEVLTKDFNMWQQSQISRWQVKPDHIRALQERDAQRRIESCLGVDGWHVFVGLDFSHGDDLFAITYLAIDYNHASHTPDTMRGLMFADCDAWVLEATLRESPNRALYEQWIAQGWLHVCPGEVFDSMLAITHMAERLMVAAPLPGHPEHKEWRSDVHMFCYDPAQNHEPINNLKAWLQSVGLPPEVIERLVVPCSQSAMNLNPIIGELERVTLLTDPWIVYSASPLWPWQFGNCAIETGRTELRRVIKGGPAPSHKIDNVMALLDALWGWQLTEGQVRSEK